MLQTMVDIWITFIDGIKFNGWSSFHHENSSNFIRECSSIRPITKLFSQVHFSFLFHLYVWLMCHVYFTHVSRVVESLELFGSKGSLIFLKKHHIHSKQKLMRHIQLPLHGFFSIWFLKQNSHVKYIVCHCTNLGIIQTLLVEVILGHIT
jgi:hypothetical protein